MTSAGEKGKLPIKAEKERAAEFSFRDAAEGASRGKNPLAVTPEPEGRKRKQVEPSRFCRVRAKGFTESLKGRREPQFEWYRGYGFMLVSKQDFGTSFFKFRKPGTARSFQRRNGSWHRSRD